MRDEQIEMQLAILANYLRGQARAARLETRSFDLACGTAGHSLFFHTLHCAFPQRGWKRYAEESLAQSLTFWYARRENQPIPLGLFTGLTGICFLLSRFAAVDPAYQPLHSLFDQTLFRTLLSSSIHQSQFSLLHGVTFEDYDVISGLSGIGMYALSRHPAKDAQAVTDMIRERFVSFSQPSPLANGHLGFFIPPNRSPHRSFAHSYPQGATDLGLAHGIAGPLAFLALLHIATGRSPSENEHRMAIRRLANWLISCRCPGEEKIIWPAAHPCGNIHQKGAWPAWCYGAPGIAWALWLAAAALGEKEWQELAVFAMQQVADDIFERGRLPSPMLCHGLAGVWQIASGFERSSDHPFFGMLSNRLRALLLASFDQTCPYGFPNHTLYPRRVSTYLEFLEGVPGIALALLSEGQTNPKGNPLFPLLLLTDVFPTCLSESS